MYSKLTSEEFVRSEFNEYNKYYTDGLAKFELFQHDSKPELYDLMFGNEWVCNGTLKNLYNVSQVLLAVEKYKSSKIGGNK